MRVIEIAESWGLDQLRIAERPEPTPGPGQAQVRMEAASLNYRDLLMVRGHYDPRQPLPLVPCSDGVGTVTAVGEGVERVAVGDRVATMFCQSWLAGEPSREKLRSTLGGPIDGALTEFGLFSAKGLSRIPAGLSSAEAACLPCAGLTAWSALDGIQSGETLLLQGTGGVSTFALQFAVAAGARAIVTSKSDAKLERVRELGAWETINYRQTPQWSERVQELTAGRGVDRVIEVGGAGTLQQSIDSVRFGGTIALIGVLSGLQSDLNIIKLLMQQIRVQGILVGHRDAFEAMTRAIETNAIRPIVDRTFPFEAYRDAFDHLASGEHFGKICIAIGDDLD